MCEVIGLWAVGNELWAYELWVLQVQEAACQSCAR